MINFLFGEKRYLGIDLGSLNIKIVEVVRKKNYLELVNFGIIPLINFKEIGTSSYILEENTASILKDFFETAKIKAKEAIFNIQAPYVFPINFFVPEIPEKSLPQVIRFESKKQLPLSLEEIEIEYRYASFQSESQQRQWLVFMTGIPKSYLKKIQLIADFAKLKLNNFGSEYFNFEPFFNNKIGNFVVFDLGHSYSTFYLVKDGKIIYGNKLRIRGYDFLDMIMNLTNFNEEKTLNLISERGLIFPPEEKEIYDAVNSFFNNLVNMVENEIQKIENTFLIKIEKIFWTGGLSVLPGFKDNIFTKISNFEQEILTPFNIFKGEKILALQEKSTLFLQPLGIVFRKLMS